MSDAVPTLDLGPADRVEGKPRFAPGTTVHNFRIIRELGAGGMGIVLEARDPELDRNVAIKIVRDHDASSTAGGRLIREAQAMARLDHPNVIGVFEVGTIDDQVFIVMELVRGDTLATWLEQPRSWRAIVGVFVQAGEGLLAAHDAGLVHRDFKPGNAMLDAEGRVRIGDFGLARTYEPDVDHGSNQSTGAGTPGYMAPEQAAGLEVDARADQYSFAVSLREALGKTRAPRRIRAAIARASSPEANDRYPSLAPLLVELRRSLQRRGRAVLLLAACVATVGVTVALVHQPAAATCDESARLIDGVWSGPMRSAVIANFAMRRPTAQIASTTKLVDEWSASWQLARHAACAADVAQREPRLRCSDQMLLLVQAQIAAWITTDATGVDRSIEAAAALPPASLCAKLETQPVVNPELARELATTEVALHAGHAVSLVPRVDALIATAQRPENADARAQVLLVVGRIERESGALDKAHDHLGRAAHEAGRAHDDKTLFDALLEQSATIADQGRPLDALGLLDAADAVAARIGLDEAGRISEQRGVMLTDAGRTVEAIAVLEKLTAQQHAREQSTTAAIAYAASSGALASAYAQHEDFGKARDVLLRVLAIEEPLYGPTHPDIGRTLADLGTDENHAGMYDAAAGHLRRAREILVQAYGEKSSPVATVDLTRAHAAIDQNDPATAQPLLEHAREIFTLVLPPDHPTLAVVEDDLGTLLRNADKCGDAVPHFRHSVAIAERAGQHGIGLANKLVNLAACLSDTGDTAGARPALVTALAELDAEHADDALRREPWAILADVEWHDGHRKEAVALATKVIASIPDGAPAEALALRTYERDQLAAWR